MENICWKCNGVGHHGRACAAPPDTEVRKEVREYYKRGPGSEGYRMKNNIAWRRLTTEKPAEREIANSSTIPVSVDSQLIKFRNFLMDI